MSGNVLKIILPVVVLVAGVVAAVLLASARTAPPRTERPSPGPLVEVVVVEPEQSAVVVTGHGQVQAKVAVEVVPQVSGTVVSVHPSLVTGGFFRAGEPLFVIDPKDYELAVDRAAAAVARAQVQLERERAEAEVAREEWDALHPEELPPSGLVVREPQVRQAEAELAAAQADLRGAQLALERTRVSVPFDGAVASESVDIGQYVTPGRTVATVFGTEAAEVRLPLETRELAWFDVPRRAGEPGPAAELSASYGGTTHSWLGRVTRMEAEVDPSSRMVTIVVEVPAPFDGSGGRPPLLPGTFVDVRILGRVLDDVIAIPRHAVHEGGVVWVFDDGTLHVRPVEVTRSDREVAYVGGGLERGDRVIVSALDAVTDGMEVRAADTPTAVDAESDGEASDPVAALGSEFRVPGSELVRMVSLVEASCLTAGGSLGAAAAPRNLDAALLNPCPETRTLEPLSRSPQPETRNPEPATLNSHGSVGGTA